MAATAVAVLGFPTSAHAAALGAPVSVAVVRGNEPDPTAINAGWGSVGPLTSIWVSAELPTTSAADCVYFSISEPDKLPTEPSQQGDGSGCYTFWVDHAGLRKYRDSRWWNSATPVTLTVWAGSTADPSVHSDPVRVTSPAIAPNPTDPGPRTNVSWTFARPVNGVPLPGFLGLGIDDYDALNVVADPPVDGLWFRVVHLGVG